MNFFDLSDFAFDHQDPDGVLHSPNRKGTIEPGAHLQKFNITNDVRATTLKHRSDACHHTGRRNFSKRS
jgi:hypothetical protein